MKGEAICVSRGLDRDRVVDETGAQTVVFGRRGARPFHLSEMLPFLRHSDGSLYRMENVVRHDEKLFTSSGRELQPLVTPTPSTLSAGERLGHKLEMFRDAQHDSLAKSFWDSF